MTEFEEALVKIQESNIANSLALGASWLESVANGEDVRRDTLRLVAGGMRNAVENCNTNISRLTGNVVGSCFQYLRCDDVDKAFWLGQMKKWSDELRESESSVAKGIFEKSEK